MESFLVSLVTFIINEMLVIKIIVVLSMNHDLCFKGLRKREFKIILIIFDHQ